MKKLYCILLLAYCMQHASAQNTFPSTGAAGIGTTTPDASSLFEIKSTTRGVLIPRMTKTQRDAITTPATGLLIYQTNSAPGFYYYDGSKWQAVVPKSKGWSLSGNAGTDPATNFIGTTDAQPLLFKVNNSKSGYIDFNNAKANTGFGFQTLNINTTGVSNTATGYQALFSNGNGDFNTATGSSALYSNTTGTGNTATGTGALGYNTSGKSNTANGYLSLYSNTTGIENTASGSSALTANTTGSYNVANGVRALYQNTTGDENTATGYLALYANTSGKYNTANGDNALNHNTTGSYNTANGRFALAYNSTGNSNAANGAFALNSNTTGNNNTADGGYALYANTTGYSNIAIGIRALYKNAALSNLVAVGDSALFNVNGGYGYCTAIGSKTLYTNTTGAENTAVGSFALYYNITGSENSANGAYSLYYNTTGGGNTANGGTALFTNTTGNNNTATGYSALYSNTTGGFNSANGVYSLYSNTTGSYNTANGYVALANNTKGSYNIAIGIRSLQSNTDISNLIAVGDSALYSLSGGSHSTAIGSKAGWQNTSGNNNTYVGYHAGNTVTTGSSNTIIGYGADVNSGAITNSTAIGNLAVAAASNRVRIGNGSVTSIGGAVAWTNFADFRTKTDVKENVPGLKFINLLKPVTYHNDINKEQSITGIKSPDALEGKYDITTIQFTGFAAQDVERAAKQIGYDFSGVDAPKNDKDLYGLRYTDFVAPLVKSVQELSVQNDSLKSENASLRKDLNDLKNIVLSIQQRLQEDNAVSAAASSSVQQLAITLTDAASLQQNVPNPFNNTTVISYSLPDKFSSAQIIITDKNGKQLKQLNLSGAGKGIVHVDASTLASGAYNYSLYVDRKLIATKQMIAAK